jgi:hypothetical protein
MEACLECGLPVTAGLRERISTGEDVEAADDMTSSTPVSEHRPRKEVGSVHDEEKQMS